MDDGRQVPVVADIVSAVRGDTTAQRRLAQGGMLIAFEGGEGAGESTQVAPAAGVAHRAGPAAPATFKPGATPPVPASAHRARPGAAGIAPAGGGAAVRRRPRPARARVLRRRWTRGEVVITDRFVDSSLAYQGAGRTHPVEDVRMSPAGRPKG